MGRPFLEYVQDDTASRYTCSKCNADVASTMSVCWEGYMGAQVQPALLFQHTYNCETYTAERKERLSTGQYVLQDVRCRACHAWLGWLYINSSNPDQKFKEGRMLLQRTFLSYACARTSDGGHSSTSSEECLGWD